MLLPKGFNTLAESQHYILGHVYEYGSIIDKRAGKEFYIGDSYGDPNFGLIDRNENWALLFGHSSYLWASKETILLNQKFPLSISLFEWPYDARQISDFEVEILSDPWSDNAAVFKFDIKAGNIIKAREFKKVEIPYDHSNKQKILW
jgi:hypothetical protein